MFKVLIAEDEPPIMRMIKSTLESVDSDFKVTECCINGKNAVEKCDKPDTPADDKAKSSTATAYRRVGSGIDRITRGRFWEFTMKVHNTIRTFCQAARKSRRDSADSDLW